MDFDILFKGKNICITGGLGSIGSQLIKSLLNFNPNKIVVIDNRETELSYAKLYSPDEKIKYEFANIQDYNSLESLLKEVDIVFHAAAMKHVPICEDSPFEAIKTNVIGTKNVIDACLKNDVKKMILISTDKVVNPISVMGATKLLAEKLVEAVATSKKNNKTKFGIVRFGNVIYSRGSVLEIWNRQFKENREIYLTDINMTRFFMTTSQCVNLIFTVTALSQDGEVFVFKMPSVKMVDFAQAFAQIRGLNKDKIKITGKRKGEKIHEELLSDSDNIILEDEKLFVIFPSYISEKRIVEFKENGFKEPIIKEFSSNNERFMLTIEEIKEFLLKEKNLLI